jgi:hypothetical protein
MMSAAAVDEVAEDLTNASKACSGFPGLLLNSE